MTTTHKTLSRQKRKTGDDRKVWHKIVDSVEKTEVCEVRHYQTLKWRRRRGDDEEFSCTITFNKSAKETPHVKG